MNGSLLFETWNFVETGTAPALEKKIGNGFEVLGEGWHMTDTDTCLAIHLGTSKGTKHHREEGGEDLPLWRVYVWNTKSIGSTAPGNIFHAASMAPTRLDTRDGEDYRAGGAGRRKKRSGT